ncbi:unnamed protein product [Acanthosepion pharaonis]|uniref:Uncharacterized protein n=1 Tax=Acanthosepion pharaonis TaxID=158019 RepID=A0A812BTL3_ACAPH|nr:unnamed protein product [Sepia pharaonis]
MSTSHCLSATLFLNLFPQLSSLSSYNPFLSNILSIFLTLYQSYGTSSRLLISSTLSFLDTVLFVSYPSILSYYLPNLNRFSRFLSCNQSICSFYDTGMPFPFAAGGFLDFVFLSQYLFFIFLTKVISTGLLLQTNYFLHHFYAFFIFRLPHSLRRFVSLYFLSFFLLTLLFRYHLTFFFLFYGPFFHFYPPPLSLFFTQFNLFQCDFFFLFRIFRPIAHLSFPDILIFSPNVNFFSQPQIRTLGCTPFANNQIPSPCKLFFSFTGHYFSLFIFLTLFPFFSVNLLSGSLSALHKFYSFFFWLLFL